MDEFYKISLKNFGKTLSYEDVIVLAWNPTIGCALYFQIRMLSSKYTIEHFEYAMLFSGCVVLFKL